MPEGWDRALTILESTCWDCHGQTDPEAHLDLTHYTSLEQLVENRGVWDKVRRRVHAGDMPPEEMEPLELDDRAWFVEWIQETLRQAAYDRREHSARAPLRRLNRAQYSNTIRDLLGIHFEAGDGLPADGAGGEGFDHAAETLFLSPIHAEKYLEAAQQALEYLSRDTRARGQLFVAQPSDDLSESDAARKILARFLTRVFRRAVTDEEIERLNGHGLSDRSDSTLDVHVWEVGQQYHNFSFLDGVPGAHHSLSHHQNEEEKLVQYERIARWHIEQLAYFMDRLAAIPEGDRNVLDNSLVLWASDLRDGNRHDPKNLPVLVGGGSNLIHTGQHLSFEKNTPLCNLYVSMLQSMGVPVSQFADSTGPLPGIVAGS